MSKRKHTQPTIKGARLVRIGDTPAYVSDSPPKLPADRMRYVAGVEMTDDYIAMLRAANASPEAAPTKSWSAFFAALKRFLVGPKCTECEELGTMCETCIHCEWGIR